MRTALVLMTILLGCGDAQNDDACDYLQAAEGCPECADGEVTCTYGDVSVTEFSCGGCQAEQMLMAELCAHGDETPAETILADMVCEDVPPE